MDDGADVADLVGEACDERLLGGGLGLAGELANIGVDRARRSPPPATGRDRDTTYQPTMPLRPGAASSK
jgi:hypothetical protein